MPSPRSIGILFNWMRLGTLTPAGSTPTGVVFLLDKENGCGIFDPGVSPVSSKLLAPTRGGNPPRVFLLRKTPAAKAGVFG